MTNQNLIKDEIISFYKNLFSASQVQYVDEVLQFIPRMVSDSINEHLLSSVSNDEVKAAVFEMGPLKAPWPDGFSGIFY